MIRRLSIRGLFHRVSAAVTIFCLAWTLAGDLPITGPGPVPTADVDAAINDCATWLTGQNQPDGSFVYRINLNPFVPVSSGYNLLRHSGALYALTQYADLRETPQLQAVLKNGATFLLTQTAPVSSCPDLMAVWSRPQITGKGKPVTAKLGGSGLGLVALCRIEARFPGTVSASVLTGLGNFICSLQKPDGQFHSRFIPSAGGPDDSWNSLYYPGEAALGLLYLHDLAPEMKFNHSAEKALAFLALARKGHKQVPADHWALLATKKLLTLPESERTVDAELLFAHAEQICESILNGRINASTCTSYIGGFSADGNVTPAACHLEGLIAAASFFPSSHPIQTRLRPAIHSGIRFLLRAQVKTGKNRGAIPRTMPGPCTRDYISNPRATEVRIDYVQHTMSALIRYRRLTSPQRNVQNLSASIPDPG